MTTSISGPVEVRGLDETLPRRATGSSDAASCTRSTTSRSLCARARSPRSSARAAAARAPSRGCSPASTSRPAGTILFEGSDVTHAKRRRDVLRYRSQVQMIFQDPFGSLNPVKTIRHHLARPLKIHGLASRAQIDERIDELLTTVGPRPSGSLRRQVPVRALGRPAAARRDRAGTCRRADGARRRRADLDARRLDPDRDPQPDARPQGTRATRVPLRHPRPRERAVRRRLQCS